MNDNNKKTTPTKPLRAYFVSFVDDEYGVAVISKTARAARREGYAWLLKEQNLTETDAPWIACTAQWIRDADITGLKEGVFIDNEEGIRRGLYLFAEGIKCEICDSTAWVSLHENKILCSTCIETLNKKEE